MLIVGGAGEQFGTPLPFTVDERPDLSGGRLALQRKDGVHFYNQDNNERPRQRSADVSFLPNEAPDNSAHIKSPL